MVRGAKALSLARPRSGRLKVVAVPRNHPEDVSRKEGASAGEKENV